MKTITTGVMLIVTTFSYFNIDAQRLEVKDQSARTEESRDVDSWTAHLDQDVSYCMSTYSDFIKKSFDLKTSKLVKGMMIVEKSVFSELSNLRIDQRTAFTSESSGTAVAFMFSPGYDIHFGHSLYKDEFAKGEMFVKNYVRFHYETYYNELMKKLQGKSKDKLNDIASNEKKIEKNKKSITDNDKKIIAGDEGAAKLQERTAKMEKENKALELEIVKYRDEITKLQDEIIAANASLVKIKEYK